jgi:stalled ribosome rescue protein Dom34
MMSKYAGVWVDQKKAYLVTIEEGRAQIKKFHSMVGRVHRSTGGMHGSMPFGMNGGGAEGKTFHRRQNQLKEYFDEIVASLKTADQIFIFGPGVAKTGLEEVVLKQKSLGKKLRAVKSAPKLTESQIKARVFNFYKDFTH